MTTIRGAAPATALPDEVLDEAALDAAIARLQEAAGRWAATSPALRADLLEAVIDSTMEAAPAWTAAACAAKGLQVDSTEGGEELFSGVGTFVTMARAFVTSLRDLERLGRPNFPGPVTTAIDGRLVVGVFPRTTSERLLFAGTTAQVIIEAGVSRAELEAGQAEAYADPEAVKGVALVLGAGNVASLGPRDVLSQLVAEGKVVLLKANPVNAYLVPHWRQALRPLLDAGVLEIVTGGAQTGAYLCQHSGIDVVHVTGSDKTYDAIVFGVGEEGAANKAARRPILDKPVTAELGSVSPVLIVPGTWSAADLRYQAEHVATMLTNNAGFNCLTPRVLLTQRSWPQREAFFDALGVALRQIPTRSAYYPGAVDRWQRFVEAHPDAERYGAAGEQQLPWTVVRGVRPSATDDICLNVEAFCGLTSECALDGEGAVDFLDRAVDFANDVVWGSLSTTILIAPKQLRDPATAAALERAVANLRYGAIGVNLFHGIAFALATPTWGAHPGHQPQDIQSGVGVVGNAYLLPKTVKSVVRGPWRSRPKPPWFSTQKNNVAVMRRLLAYQAHPSARHAAAVLRAALG